MTTRRSSPARGTTLIELMIAMLVLVVGLIGMWRMHILGITSTAAGRRHTQAMGIAQEVASGLERLAFADPRLSPNGSTGPTPPTGFGRLTVSAAAGYHEWSDGDPVPGVRLNSELNHDVFYSRRWTVWGYSPVAGNAPSVKLVAVSVTWGDLGFNNPREVIAYTQLNDMGFLASMLGASQ